MKLAIPTTSNDGIIDITQHIEEVLEEQSVENGVVTIFVHHTTAALSIMDLDPGTDLDFLNAIRHLLPHLTYRHPHNPSHAPDHILATLIGMSVSIPFENRHMTLGTWQRVVLVELDGPKTRQITLTLVESV
ncbi:MAG TPA: secondary thiamine-phosphate synthase enzyme YjbQ [Patescibacteria group bacterium]|nr:secondary thiamine-phosphate synthase enzyme YjbQ [Patescibacteria group bacterium]